jgi:3-methyladenine DNA glycosylase AlkD
MARAPASPLLAKLRRELGRAADPARAAGMQAYMKSEMPFHGVAAPQLRAICKRVFAEHPLADAAQWRKEVLALWRGARFRDERYAAVELARDRRARAFQTMESLPMYEELIVDGAWWDIVDTIASHLLSAILVNEPKPMRKAMLAWSRDENMWKRRSAILCQLPFKAKTDLDLLYACIEPSLGRKEFFLRKAIGWALRAYAWTDPEEVARFVRENEGRLSPLSIREALKNVTSSPARAGRRRSASADRRTPPRADRSR